MSTLNEPPPNKKVANFEEISKPILGFRSPLFLGHEKVIAIADNCLRYVDLSNYGSNIEDIDFEAPITSIAMSQDFMYLVLCVDLPRGAMLITKTAEGFETLTSFPARSTPIKMFFSFTNEVLVALALDDNAKTAILNCYGPVEGSFLGETEISTKNSSKNWEISVCPADETVICLKSDEIAYLLRRTSDEILIFSSIKLFDISCHAWADDVTLAFGTNDGQIRLYRETVPLKNVDLKPLHQSLLGSDVPSGTKVVSMYATDEILLVAVEIGIVYVFGSPENPERWKNSKAIVITSLLKSTTCLGLHLDPSNDHLLYTDHESSWICDLRYSEAVCKEGMRLVLAKHSHPIKYFSIDPESGIFASVDTSGLLIVTSLWTRKTLAYANFSNFIGTAIIPGGHQILVGTHEKLIFYNILLYKFEEIEVVFEDSIQVMSPSPCNKLVFIGSTRKFLFLKMEKFEKFIEGVPPCQHDIFIAKWSEDGKNIGILTQKDDVYVIDSRNGTMLCMLEFKLRFFIDISIFEDTIFLITNKFLLHRIKNSKELDPINMHAEGISFKKNSTGILFNGKSFYMSTDFGNILKASAKDIEHIKNLHVFHPASITLMSYIQKSGTIFLGFEDGHISSLKIENIDQQFPTPPQENLILAPLDDLIRYKTLLNELNVERNLVRAQAERIFNEYKELKEAEVERIRSNLENEIEKSKLKMKDLEERCEIAELTKDQTIEKMRHEYNFETEKLKNRYEEMLNDHIRSSLTKDETTQKTFFEMEQNFQNKIQELSQAFQDVQFKMEKKLAKMHNRNEKLKGKILDLEQVQDQMEGENFLLVEKYEKMLENRKIEMANAKNEFLNKIKDIKADMLIIEDERDAQANQVKMYATKIEFLTNELNNLKNSLEQKTVEIKELHKQSLEHENLNADLKKTLGKINQKSIIFQKEIDHEKFLRNQAERRLFEFESKLEEMSHHVYDPRKLEQSVLALLAFFHSPNQTTTVVSKKKLF